MPAPTPAPSHHPRAGGPAVPPTPSAVERTSRRADTPTSSHHPRVGARHGLRRALGAALLVGVLAGASGCAAADDSSPSSSPSAPAAAGAPTEPATASTAPAPEPATTPPATTAPATPSPITVEELGRGEQEAAVDVEVDGPTQVAFRRITIAPGGGTGLHCHDGQLVAVVEKGVFTHYAPVYPTGVHEYQAGDSIVEGAHYVHEGKNEGTEDVVLLVSYVIEAGEPLAETDLAKCDPE